MVTKIIGKSEKKNFSETTIRYPTRWDTIVCAKSSRNRIQKSRLCKYPIRGAGEQYGKQSVSKIQDP